MGRYSIKEIEKLSGIKAHTIRIWEKRHQVIKPRRTSGNIRYYNDDDLKKVMNISILNNYGIKISKIANLSNHQLAEKVVALSETVSDEQLYIDQLIVSMVEYDEIKFEKLLAKIIIKYGFEETIIGIVYPFLEKIGVLWLSGNINPAQEHFMSNLIRQKLIVAIDDISVADKSLCEKFVLFLPENELHEIGLLFYHYLVKKSGFSVIYLGQSVPFNDLQEVNKVYKPDYFLGSITSSMSKEEFNNLILMYSNTFSDCTFYLSGYQISQHSIAYPDNITTFNNAKDLKNLLRTLRAKNQLNSTSHYN